VDVTVIIPTYNRLWCLPKAIDSCRNTICETQIIVVDDGSTDGTWEWLQSQSDVLAIYQENQGKCWAINNSMSLVLGKYIKFLDSDDVISENAIDAQFILAENNNTDIVVAGYEIISENGNTISKQHWVTCNDFIAQQLGECDSSHYTAYLFKTDFIKFIPHRPDFAFRDDRMLCIEAAIKKPKIVVFNGFSFKHRVHSKIRLQFNNGLQQTVQNYQHLNIYKKAYLQLSLINELTERRKNTIAKALWPLAHWIAKTNVKEATKVKNWIYELNPNFNIPDKGIIGWMHKNLGFKITMQILVLRRSLKYGIRYSFVFSKKSKHKVDNNLSKNA
jgi:glycosyltransferase involved in cell wall biosynthesis